MAHHRNRSYAPDATRALRPKQLPRTEQLARCEIERRAAVFDAAMVSRDWSNEMAARRLGCDERYVRRLRSAERPLHLWRLKLLGELGALVMELLGIGGAS